VSCPRRPSSRSLLCRVGANRTRSSPSATRPDGPPPTEGCGSDSASLIRPVPSSRYPFRRPLYLQRRSLISYALSCLKQISKFLCDVRYYIVVAAFTSMGQRDGLSFRSVQGVGNEHGADLLPSTGPSTYWNGAFAEIARGIRGLCYSHSYPVIHRELRGGGSPTFEPSVLARNS
jgi:hypothetical protein